MEFLTDSSDIDILNYFIRQDFEGISPTKYTTWKDNVLEVFHGFL